MGRYFILSCIAVGLALREVLPVANATEERATLEPKVTNVPNDNRYFVHNRTEQTFFQALLKCYRDKMQLATFNNQSDFQQLTKLLLAQNATQNATYWTSGSELAERDRWTWMTNGIDLEYTPWRDGKPSQEEGKQCIGLSTKYKYQMENLPCSTKMFLICEVLPDCKVSKA